eukprot:2788214-Pyramimonas_sp.AAC.1
MAAHAMRPTKTRRRSPQGAPERSASAKYFEPSPTASGQRRERAREKTRPGKAHAPRAQTGQPSEAAR